MHSDDDPERKSQHACCHDVTVRMAPSEDACACVCEHFLLVYDTLHAQSPHYLAFL